MTVPASARAKVWSAVRATLTAAVTVVAYAYLTGGWNYRSSSLSPDGQYRLDFYEARRWQALASTLELDADPGFARMTRLADNAFLGESGLITLAEIQVLWEPDAVLVSTQASFDFPSGAWR